MVCLRKPVNRSLRPKPKERPVTKFEVKRSGHLIGCCVSLGGVNGILISYSARKLAARELHYGKKVPTESFAENLTSQGSFSSKKIKRAQLPSH
ncbi:hypothetical protein CEXT_558171 [Caerostris extrusa]|uniref:Uncharacterized protein n=1 Tax=Caerostris extrusa TaxID=172846 RepID=A0AAV4WDZ7_CAEEX|nr:hypothetical protein CEXT_558171 [Caerostris extrusa]